MKALVTRVNERAVASLPGQTYKPTHPHRVDDYGNLRGPPSLQLRGGLAGKPCEVGTAPAARVAAPAAKIQNRKQIRLRRRIK